MTTHLEQAQKFAWKETPQKTPYTSEFFMKTLTDLCESGTTCEREQSRSENENCRRKESENGRKIRSLFIASKTCVVVWHTMEKSFPLSPPKNWCVSCVRLSQQFSLSSTPSYDGVEFKLGQEKKNLVEKIDTSSRSTAYFSRNSEQFFMEIVWFDRWLKVIFLHCALVFPQCSFPLLN